MEEFTVFTNAIACLLMFVMSRRMFLTGVVSAVKIFKALPNVFVTSLVRLLSTPYKGENRLVLIPFNEEVTDWNMAELAMSPVVLVWDLSQPSIVDWNSLVRLG
jgi:hypothetical protein